MGRGTIISYIWTREGWQYLAVIFDLYRLGDIQSQEARFSHIETQLAPTLAPGDEVILDYLSVHNSAKAEAAVCARAPGCTFCSNTRQT